jgi:hypothetical protein
MVARLATYSPNDKFPIYRVLGGRGLCRISTGVPEIKPFISGHSTPTSLIKRLHLIEFERADRGH